MDVAEKFVRHMLQPRLLALHEVCYHVFQLVLSPQALTLPKIAYVKALRLVFPKVHGAWAALVLVEAGLCLVLVPMAITRLPQAVDYVITSCHA